MHQNKTETHSDWSRLQNLWMRSPSLKTVLMLILLAFLTFHTFSGALHCDFVPVDDPDYIINNPHVNQGLTRNGIIWAFSNTEQANWHPLTWISHMLDVEFYGLNPKGHHLTNVCIHILNTLLCFLLFRSMTGRFWTSVFIALFWGIHPLRVESVVWISERKDVLCAFFGLLSLITYSQYAQKKNLALYILTLLLLALGLLSKAMIVTWPFLFLLLDYWPYQRFEKSTSPSASQKQVPSSLGRICYLILEKIPFFILVFIFSLLAFRAQSSEGTVIQLQEFSFWMRIQNAVIAYVMYLKSGFYPFPLAVMYPMIFSNTTKWKFLASLVFLAAVTLTMLRFRKQKAYLPTGWCWYLGTLVPVIGIIQISVQARADRYTYLPSLGILLIVCMLAADWAAKSRLLKKFILTSSVILVFVFIFSSWIYTEYWKNGLMLFGHAESVTKNNPIVWINYGYGLELDGQYDQAIEQYTKSIPFMPDNPDVWIHLGRIHLKTKEYQKAFEYLEKANRLTRSGEPLILEMMAKTCLIQEKYKDAKQYAETGIQLARQYHKIEILNRLITLQDEINLRLNERNKK